MADSLGDDLLAKVLARAPFREPLALHPPGFYWNPLMHTAMRLTCHRFQRVVDSHAYRHELSAAPVGRVTLREAKEHIQTCLALNALVAVRAVVTRWMEVQPPVQFRVVPCRLLPRYQRRPARYISQKQIRWFGCQHLSPLT